MPINMAAIPAGITLLIPSCVRYTAGYFRNSFFSVGSTAKNNPPSTKYARNPPSAERTTRPQFICNPSQVARWFNIFRRRERTQNRCAARELAQGNRIFAELNSENRRPYQCEQSLKNCERRGPFQSIFVHLGPE